MPPRPDLLPATPSLLARELPRSCLLHLFAMSLPAAFILPSWLRARSKRRIAQREELRRAEEEQMEARRRELLSDEHGCAPPAACMPCTSA